MNTHCLTAFRTALFAVAMLFLASAISSTAALAALSGQITGTVTDAVSHSALAGVKVVVASPSGTYAATTDANGKFSIVGVVPDTYNVSFQLARYDDVAQDGVTVVADTPQVVNVSLTKTLVQIAHLTTRARTRATRDTEDSYTVSAHSIEQLQGKADDTDEKSLLQKLPSVTLDKSGVVFIRGGDAFQVGYQLDGVDTTVANRTLQNKEENVGNFDLLNGIGAAQLIPGGGDASHGDSGTGLVSLTAKRGTSPSSTNIDLEGVAFPYDHQFSVETGGLTPNGRFSYYLSFTGVRQQFQYGQPGTPGANLGIYTDATSLTSINGANAVGVISTAADQESNDLLGNFFYKFGKNNSQYVQFLVQNQIVRQGENYNGFANLCYASCSPSGTYLGAGLTGSDPELQAVVPLFPGQAAFNENVGAEDAIYSPFDLDKIEYGNNINASTYVVGRLFTTTSNQIENRPSIGIDNPSNGGTRSGFSTELDKQLGKHFLQIGGQYEFVDPYGTLEDVANYEYGYFGSAGNVSPNEAVPSNASCLGAGGCLPTAPVVYDFLPATSPDCNAGSVPGSVAFTGSGINIGSATPANPATFMENVPCGYLSKYFPGAIPRLPAEIESPQTQQQVFGYYLQDRFPLGANASVQAGMRFDGYNFLFPDDPENPESISTVRHQRLFEPHLGITRLVTPRDSIRATYGRTLSIPLPGLSGNSIDRSTFDPYNNVPSYNNLTGKPATYCGLSLDAACTSYADQLFWLMRDVRFPTSDLAPLRGATFTNYDFTYFARLPVRIVVRRDAVLSPRIRYRRAVQYAQLHGRAEPAAGSAAGRRVESRYTEVDRCRSSPSVRSRSRLVVSSLRHLSQPARQRPAARLPFHRVARSRDALPVAVLRAVSGYGSVFVQHRHPADRTRLHLHVGLSVRRRQPRRGVPSKRPAGVRTEHEPRDVGGRQHAAVLRRSRIFGYADESKHRGVHGFA